MAIGKINVEVLKGDLGLTVPNNYGVSALVVYNKSTSGKLVNDKVFAVTSLDDYTKQTGDTGAIAAADSYVYDEVANFYRYTQNKGNTLYVVPTAKVVGDLVKATADIFVSTDANKNILAKSKNQINLVGFALKKGLIGDKGEGMSAALEAAMPVANATAEGLVNRGIPMSFVFSCPIWQEKALTAVTAERGKVTELADWKSTKAGGRAKVLNLTRCSILLGELMYKKGDTKIKQTTAIGSLLGRLAYIPVQRKASRKLNGSLALPLDYIDPADNKLVKVTTVLTDGKDTEASENEWEAITDKGYIIFRTFRGSSGYYFSGDPTLAPVDNSRYSISRARAVDKAIIILNEVYQSQIDEELLIDPKTGKIEASTADYLKNQGENAIKNLMVSNREISGVAVQVDPDQDVLGNKDVVKVDVSIVPVGYMQTINITLGLTKTV